MGDISDVEQALADSISGMLYPQGSSQSSVIGVPCRIYRGWPNAASLNSDLSADIVNVTISPDNESGKTTTRYLPEWQFTMPLPTLTAQVTGQDIVIGGVATAGNVIGALVNGRPYIYRIVAGDTPILVAANLCAAIQGNFTAIETGASISVPEATNMVVRVVCDNTAFCEGRRQQKDIRVICWCPTPSIRDAIAAAIDLSVAKAAFLALPDSTSARIEYRSTTTSDQSQNALLYRRDLVYCVEYPTIISILEPSMLFGAAAINGQISYG